jgi:hypothetical protein
MNGNTTYFFHFDLTDGFRYCYLYYWLIAQGRITSGRLTSLDLGIESELSSASPIKVTYGNVVRRRVDLFSASAQSFNTRHSAFNLHAAVTHHLLFTLPSTMIRLMICTDKEQSHNRGRTI